MMNEKFSDVRDFVRELIKTYEFEDELFLSTINIYLLFKIWYYLLGIKRKLKKYRNIGFFIVL